MHLHTQRNHKEEKRTGRGREVKERAGGRKRGGGAGGRNREV